MPREAVKLVLSSEQLETLARMGVDFKGQELVVSLLAGRIPVIRPAEERPDAAVEDIIICVTGC